MSIWAEIKHSINNDLDTPLNVLINGSKGFVPSDNLYYMIQKDKLYVGAANNITLPKKIKINWNGSVNFKYYLKSTYTNNPETAELRIYKNDTLYRTQYGKPEDNQRVLLLDVSRGDVLSFQLANTSTGGTNSAILHDFGIYADLIDSSGITVEII